MNDKDKEAFEKWFNEERRLFESSEPATYTDSDEWLMEKGWQAACEYMQQKINAIDCYIERDEKIRKLKAENKKLRECVSWYADVANQIAPAYDPSGKPGAEFTQPYRMDSGKRARQVLKELE